MSYAYSIKRPHPHRWAGAWTTFDHAIEDALRNHNPEILTEDEEHARWAKRCIKRLCRNLKRRTGEAPRPSDIRITYPLELSSPRTLYQLTYRFLRDDGATPWHFAMKRFKQPALSVLGWQLVRDETERMRQRLHDRAFDLFIQREGWSDQTSSCNRTPTR